MLFLVQEQYHAKRNLEINIQKIKLLTYIYNNNEKYEIYQDCRDYIIKKINIMEIDLHEAHSEFESVGITFARGNVR